MPTWKVACLVAFMLTTIFTALSIIRYFDVRSLRKECAKRLKKNQEEILNQIKLLNAMKERNTSKEISTLVSIAERNTHALLRNADQIESAFSQKGVCIAELEFNQLCLSTKIARNTEVLFTIEATIIELATKTN